MRTTRRAIHAAFTTLPAFLHRSRPCRQKSGRTPAPLRLETLEQRTLLTINVPYVTSGSLVIDGSDEADTARVEVVSPGVLEVTIESGGESHVERFGSTSVQDIIFRGRGGDDRVDNLTDLGMVAYGGEGNDTLVSGGGNDTLRGENGDDVLIAGDGADSLFGDSGNDTLLGGGGADQFYGGPGNDIQDGGDGDDILRGHDGEDDLRGGLGDDVLYGGDDNDQLSGGGGADTVNGNSGDDDLSGGDGNDRLSGGEGNDVVDGGAGDDQVDGDAGDDLLYGGLGDDTIRGFAGRDKIYGNGGADTAFGGDDDDRIHGDEGEDTLHGDDGNDFLSGRDDNDRLYGGHGNDSVLGGEGDDQLDGDAGDDLIRGGPGNDVLRGHEGRDRLRGERGDDTLFGGEGDDILIGDAGNDVLRGQGGNDSITGRDGNDSAYGGEGNDKLFGGNGVDDLNGDLGNDKLDGGADGDVLRGDAGRDLLDGGSGDDFLYGGDDDDQLIGDLGNDTLQGNDGNDSISGGDGNDSLDGGIGDDDLAGDDGDDTLVGDAGNDFVDAGNGDDALHGDDGDDTLIGAAGADIVFGGAGNDRIDGGDGDDQLHGAEGDDTVIGNAGADRLTGGAGRNLLLGGAGDDLLTGGPNADVLVGGQGEDDLNSKEGDDILIGGADVDVVYGSLGSDVLIGGSTSFDASEAALSALLTAWQSPADYQSRVAALEDPSAAYSLRVSETVFDDLVSDSLTGADGDDWFVVTGAPVIFDPLGAAPGEGHEDNGSNHGGHSHGSMQYVSTPPAVEGFAFIDSIDQVEDRGVNESVSSLLPHADDAVRQSEHLALFELVKYADVTHTAIASGDWSSASTWAGGAVPGAGARILVPVGVTLTVDRVLDHPAHTIRVDGELNFATTVNTELRVDTLIVSPVGRLEIGSAATPIASNVSARLRFTDAGAIDRDWDPFGLSRGLITHGSVEMHGTPMDSHLAITSAVGVGARTLRLATRPAGWKVGDAVVISGARPGEHESRTIRSIRGSTVTVDPLVHDHTPPSTSYRVHVTNLDRNIVIDSEASSADRSGHVMFMHNRDVHVNYVRFDQLGRTNKSEPVTDPVVNGDWELEPGAGANDRARYAVHFHRTGTLDDGNPSSVNGSVVVGGPGWGFVTHSSNVNFTGNAAYEVNGAGFVAEAGDEVGRFDGNIAIATSGSGEDLDNRFGRQDFAHTGEGFWFQGAGLEVVNNVSAGNDGSGFAYYTLGLVQDGALTWFNPANLDDPSIAGGASRILVDHVPVKEFSNNVAYASGVGLTLRYNLRNAPHDAVSLVEDSAFWNNTIGVNLPYSHQTVLRNLEIVHEFGPFPQFGVNSNAVTKDTRFEDLVVAGYSWGIAVPRGGFSVIDNGEFANKTNIVIRPPVSAGRTVDVTGDLVFHTLPRSLAGGSTQYEVIARFDTNPEKRTGIQHLFRDHTITLNYGDHVNQRLYFAEQWPGAVPFPSPGPDVPAAYVGLTTAEIQAQFGVTIGGELAPLDGYSAVASGGQLVRFAASGR